MAKPDPTNKLLDELVAGKTREEILGNDGHPQAVDQTPRGAGALEGEMTHHLGYEPHAPEGKNTGNSRNGKTTKTVISESGEMEITVPRDRNAEFEPTLVPKRQRRLPEFDDKVIALYARGMTTREIQGHLHELYGVEVSPQLISHHIEMPRTDAGPLFLSGPDRRIGTRQVQMRFAHWRCRAGLDRHYSVHCLRHTFATRLYQQTRDLHLVREALGHASVGTTQRYAVIDERSLRAAINRLA